MFSSISFFPYAQCWSIFALLFLVFSATFYRSRKWFWPRFIPSVFVTTRGVSIFPCALSRPFFCFLLLPIFSLHHNFPPRRLSAVEVHPNFSEAQDSLKELHPLPENRLSKNQIASRWIIPWPKRIHNDHFFETRSTFWWFWSKEPLSFGKQFSRNGLPPS